MKTTSNNSKWLYTGIITFAVFFGIYLYFPNNPTQRFNKSGFYPPQPAAHENTYLPQKEKNGEKVPAEWINKIHKAAPGDDWRKIEANSFRQLIAAKQQGNNANLQGDWLERGPSNIPGRIVDIEIDYTHNKMYAHSDHGIIFRADDLEGTNFLKSIVVNR